MFNFLFNRNRMSEAELRRFIEIEYPPLQREEAYDRLSREFKVA